MFLNEFGEHVNMSIEEMSRRLCDEYVKAGDHCLELGARYGTVSVFLSKLLHRGTQLVSVEPDPDVHECLEMNRDRNGAEFHIVKGVVSDKPLYLVHHPCVWEQKTYSDVDSFDGRRISLIQNYTIDELEKKYNLSFNVLVADCEGFLIEFFEKNRDFISRLDIIIYEEDCTASHPINGNSVSYDEFESFLMENGFQLKADLVDHIGLHNKVWTR